MPNLLRARDARDEWHAHATQPVDLAVGDAEIYPVALWDPGDPQLYRVTYELVDDDHIHDSVRGYFGMRKISTMAAADEKMPSMLCLNNKPIYIDGIF